jgi:hypothetical protein
MPREMLLSLEPLGTARPLADVRLLELFGVDLKVSLEMPLSEEGSFASRLGAGDWMLEGRNSSAAGQAGR